MNVGSFEFCPYCGTALRMQHAFARVRPTCPSCGYVYFKDPKVAVIGLITDADHLLMIQRGVDPAKGKWALPGGFMDAGEMPEEALVREVDEEVGLSVQVDDLLDIFPMVGHGSTSRGIVIAYRASPLVPGRARLLSQDDVIAADWFTHDNLPEEIAFDSTQSLISRWHNG